MIAIPAVDVRGGVCVHLTGGQYGSERVPIGNAAAVARSWQQLGFNRLHVVDLDAAFGTGSNLPVVEDILRESDVEVQVGGGIRSTDAVEQLFRAGADRVIVGSRAVQDLDWLGDLTAMYPGLVVVATDVRDRRVVTRGWVRTLPVDVLDLLGELNSLSLGGVFVTALQLGSETRGLDLALMEDVADKAEFPVIVAGGVSSMHDLRALEHRGIAGTVIGMALYTGALDARAVAQEFGE